MAKLATKRKPPRGVTGARADGGLTQKQEMYCLAFVETGNASEAYRRAYSAKHMRVKTVHECASRVLADRKVSARVADLRAKAAERAELSVADVMASLARVLRFDPRKLVDGKGKAKALHELDEDTALALNAVEIDGMKVRVDRSAARDQAMKHLGMYERDNTQKPLYVPPVINIVPVQPPERK